MASLLTAVQPPGATGLGQPIQALITPKTPDVDADGIARIYVWPATGNEKRLAIHRAQSRAAQLAGQAGQKTLTHDLRLFLVWMDDPNDPNADINFPVLIDWVVNILRTSQNPVQWTDPYLGITSNFVNLGEVQSYDFVPPRALSPDALRRYDAQIRCTLLELITS